MTMWLAAAIVAASAAVAQVPPPPPAPLPDSIPKEVGGYSTNRMNAVYQGWLRSNIVKANEVALKAAHPKSFSRAGGDAVFQRTEGPTVSARPAFSERVDVWHFDYVCPMTDAGRDGEVPIGGFSDYLDAIREQCFWQAINAHGVYPGFGPDIAMPDFDRFAALLKEAGVTEPGGYPSTRQALEGLGDPIPYLLREAIEVRTYSSRECPGVSKALESLENAELTIDVPNFASPTANPPPPPRHGTLFKAEVPITLGSKGNGTVTTSDFGSGIAYESWKTANDAIGACAGTLVEFEAA